MKSVFCSNTVLEVWEIFITKLWDDLDSNILIDNILNDILV